MSITMFKGRSVNFISLQDIITHMCLNFKCVFFSNSVDVMVSLAKRMPACCADAITGPWASYQIRKVARCACDENAGNVLPVTDFKGNRWLAIPPCINGTCVTHVPLLMSGSLTRAGLKNIPGIPGACATRNNTYLGRGPFPNPLEFTVLCFRWKIDTSCTDLVMLHSCILFKADNFILTDIHALCLFDL